MDSQSSMMDSFDGHEEEGKATDDFTADAMSEMKGEDGEEDEEEEDEDQFDSGIDAMEVSNDHTKNTPLLWATHCGHMRVIWLLLNDGYSPNDVDKMGNNAVHLAAAYGDVKIMQVIINDGGNANAVNHYKNLPIDMAKNKAIRDIVSVAMVTGASMTDEDRRIKHEQNMKQYQRMMNTLVDAIQEAGAHIQSTTSTSSNMIVTNAFSNKKINRMLLDAIELGKEYALDLDYIKQAEDLLQRWEVTQDLMQDIVNLQKIMPIKTQTNYIDNVYRLEKSIEKAIQYGIDQNQIQLALDLIARCQTEYWLSVLLTRLQDVTTADDSNEHDMNKLRAAMKKAQLLQADEAMIDQGNRFLGRLDAELGMTRALKNIPPIKLPMENAPEGYYTERDIGKVKETEGYPLPPAETGEYVWIPAESFTQFVDAINRLKSVMNGSEQLGANPNIVAEAKERIAKAEKEMKQLEAKDANDKLVAIEAVKKLAKKLKGKKKK